MDVKLAQALLLQLLRTNRITYHEYLSAFVDMSASNVK